MRTDRLPTWDEMADEWDAIAARELRMARASARAIWRYRRDLVLFAEFEDPTGYLETEYAIERERRELAQWLRDVQSARAAAIELRHFDGHA